MMTEKVILIVKAANQSSVDQKIECDLDWKVRFLKEEISKTHPAKPPVEEQRLIYSGQLLLDSLPLRTVLRHPSDNNEYTIHMVCSTTKSTSVKQSDSNSPARTSNTSHVASNESNTHNEAVAESTDGLRHRITSEQVPAIGVPQQGIDTSIYSSFSQLPLPPQAMTDPIQQMAVMQQMYAQYMSSYMQYIQSGSYESGRFFQEVTTSTPIPSSVGNSGVSDTDNQENSPRPQPQVPNNEQEPQRNAQGRGNQGGVGEEEDEGIARDWLDYIYFGSRMGVLLFIVYFYSTFTRFIVVAGITILIYLYQCGCFRLRRFEHLEQQQQQQQQDDAQPLINQDEANRAQPNAPLQPGPEESGASRQTLQEEDGGGEEEREEASSSSSASNEEGVQNVSEGQPSTPNPMIEDLPPQPPSLLALSWTFVTTFFTSLIPDQQQII